MPLMLGKLHDALIAAGADETRAREAAEEVAAYDRELAEIKATQKLHSWMLATNTVLLLAILGKLLLH
jgi:hypothetical protein